MKTSFVLSLLLFLLFTSCAKDDEYYAKKRKKNMLGSYTWQGIYTFRVTTDTFPYDSTSIVTDNFSIEDMRGTSIRVKGHELKYGFTDKYYKYDYYGWSQDGPYQLVETITYYYEGDSIHYSVWYSHPYHPYDYSFTNQKW